MFGDEEFAIAVPGKSLRVTVAVRVDVGTSERVARRYLAVAGNAQDLARKTAEVLRELTALRPSRRDIQVPVRTDG